MGAAGGSFALAGATLAVPPGVLAQDVTITVRDGTDVVSGGHKAAGPALLFEPSSLTFGSAVTLTLPVDPVRLLATGKGLADVRVFYRDEQTGQVTILTVASVNATANTVTVQTTRLGTFQTGVVAVVDPATSTVVLNTGSALADGSSQVGVSVTARTAASELIPGATVVLSTTGSGNAVVQPTGPTNAQGVALGSLTSTVAEAKTITATVNGVVLTQQPTVTFTNPVAPAVPVVSITSPRPGDVLQLDAPVRVVWTSSALGGTLDLAFSTDAGASYTPIVAGLAPVGSTTWSPPVGTTVARLRLRSTQNTAVVDQQVSDFTFAKVWFVNPAATGTRDGLTWATGVERIQTAVVLATATQDQVWVANGTYTALNGGDAGVVLLRPGVRLFGGFTGIETSPSERAAGARSTLDGENFRCGVDYRTDAFPPAEALVDGFSFVRGFGGEAGGGLAVVQGNVRVRGCRFEGNQADLGGGLFCDDSTLVVTRCEFVANAGGLRGGGMYLRRVSSGKPALVEDCTFTDNTSSVGNGGGLALHVGSTAAIDIVRCSFARNGAVNGGGLFSCQGTPAIQDCTFDRNQAVRGGGGVAFSGVSVVTSTTQITGTTFVDNSAGGDSLTDVGRSFGGGALLVDGCDAATRVARSSFFANVSTFGGALHVKGFRSDVAVENCVLADNVGYGVGGAIFTGSSGKTDVAFSTFSRNIGAGGGGAYGVMASTRTATIVGSILHGDVSGEIGSVDSTTRTTVTTSLIEGSPGDPRFVNPGARDYHLQAGSAAIGLGPTSGAPAVDRDGLARDAAPDAGAFERR